MKHYKIWLDGGLWAHDDKQSMCYGSYFVVDMKSKRTIHVRNISLGVVERNYNNESEWRILLYLMRKLLKLESAEVALFIDSLSTINRILHDLGRKEIRTQKYAKLANKYLHRLNDQNVNINLEWISGKDMKRMIGH